MSPLYAVIAEPLLSLSMCNHHPYSRPLQPTCPPSLQPTCPPGSFNSRRDQPETFA